MQAIGHASNQASNQASQQSGKQTIQQSGTEQNHERQPQRKRGALRRHERGFHAEDQMSAHIAAIAASGVAAEAEALANRQADMAAKERRETRLAILAAIGIFGAVIVDIITHIAENH